MVACVPCLADAARRSDQSSAGRARGVNKCLSTYAGLRPPSARPLREVFVNGSGGGARIMHAGALSKAGDVGMSDSIGDCFRREWGGATHLQAAGTKSAHIR